MKRNEDIERLLRDSRLPDRNGSKDRHDVWERVLKARKDRPKRSLLLRVRPWMWALASILLVLLCVLFMLMIRHTG